MDPARGIQVAGLQDLRRLLLDSQGIRCQLFEEVLAVFCRALPVKKMTPSDRVGAQGARGLESPAV